MRLAFFVLAGASCLVACGSSPDARPAVDGTDSGVTDDGGTDADSAPPGEDTTPGTVLTSATPATDHASPGKALARIPTVYMNHNDLAHTGANLSEVALEVANVNKDSFGLLFSRSVVGQIYAQPLYAPSVTMGDGTVHDIVVVATEHDDVYAFDAADPKSIEPLWHVHLADPVPTSELLGGVLYCSDLSPEVGITATPTIDPETNTLYVETKEKVATGTYTHRLHALVLGSGAERAGSPAEITAAVAGTGDGSSEGLLTFDPLKENARAAITLTHGVLWLTYAGHCDGTPFHGWVYAYEASTLKQLGVWVDTPNTWAGGIWMAGQGVTADDNGDVFLISGNAPYSEAFESTPAELGDTFAKLHLTDTGIEVADYFTPFNEDFLGANDLDLGSTGIMFVPGTRWLIGAGKEGKLYVVDRDDMGKFHEGDDSQIVQSFQATQASPEYGHPLYGSPVYWQKRIYLWGVDDDLRAYHVGDDGFDVTPEFGAVGVKPAMPGGILSISADGATPGSAVLWASHPKTDAGRTTSQGVLRAFDAADISHELWNSEQVPDRDAVGTFAKFTPPTVAAGRVYLATFSSKLQVYGLLSP